MADYVAFLRAINVGGHNLVPMQELRKAFTSLRFKNVRTLLASGNVLFEAPKAGTAVLERRIETKLLKTFGREIGVLLRSREHLELLGASQPFKGILVTPQTKFYVTFLSEKPVKSLQVRYESPGGDFTILRASTSEVFSVLTVSPNAGSTDLMKILEKRFGLRITTRNWQTIVRVLKAYQQ